MKTKNHLTLMVLFLSCTLKIYAKDSSNNYDTLNLRTNLCKHHWNFQEICIDTIYFYKNPDTLNEKPNWHFEKEKGGAVCTDGLEKIEIAMGVSSTGALSSVQILQLNFDGPNNTSGRIFVLGTQENGEHFIGGTLDATFKKFPVHAGYTFGLDQVHLVHDTTFVTYIGPGVTFYPSDIKLFHPYFHIIRLGVYYEKLTKVNAPEDDRKLGYGLSYNFFFQTQSYERREDRGKIYLEGSYKKRGSESFTELFVRYRDERFAEGLINFALKSDWKNSMYNSTSIVVGFNLTRPNTAHI